MTVMNVSHPVKREAIRVFVASSSPEETAWLCSKLSEAPDIRVIGRASSKQELDAAVSHFMSDFDVLVTDVQLKKEDVVPEIEKIISSSGIDVLVYTSISHDNTVIRAILAGATGYLLKGDQEDIVTSLRLIRGGGSPVSPTVARSVLRAIHSRTVGSLHAKPAPKADITPLSQRESEILALMAKGIPFAEIGEILSISTHTVTAHIKKIYRKLQVHSRGEAVYEATCMGLLPQERII